MLRVLLLVAVVIVIVTVLNLTFPEKRTIVLATDIDNFVTPPSELIQAVNDGWTVTRSDSGRVYTLERPRLRIP